MPSEAKPAVRRVLGGLLVVAVLGTGCSSQRDDSTPAPVGPATAATAPAPTATPAGDVRKLDVVAQSAMADAGISALVVLGGSEAGRADTLTVLPRTGAARTLRLPAPATALVSDGAGRALAATRGGYLSIDLRAGTAERIGVDGGSSGGDDTDFTAVARRADGALVLGSADGSVWVLSSPTAVAHREKPVTRVDSLVAQGDTVVVLDRAQTSVTAVGPDGKKQQALRAGEGATTMVADSADRVLVADTRGESLLVFGVDPLILRQRFPVRSAPYGVAGSSGLAWVSQTASNTVIGYDLSTGIPVEKVRYPTVQQPNILTYDEPSGVLYVVSGGGAGVQTIDHAGAPR